MKKKNANEISKIVERRFGERFFELILDKMDEATGFNWLDPVYFKAGDIGYSTRKPYQGGNRWMLNIIRQFYGYESRVWITEGQLRKLHETNPEVTIKEGARPACVAYWFLGLNAKKKTKKEESAETEDEESETDKEEETDSGYSYSNRWYCKYFNVYNTDQLTGNYPFKQPEIHEATKEEVHTMDEYESMLTAHYRKGAPAIYFDQNGRNFYKPMSDEIHLSEKQLFKSPEEFMSTCAHELVHSTGHYTRLDRLGGTNAAFGSEDYGKEELVAELGSSMLCAELGIYTKVIDNQAEYLKNWYKAIKANPEMLFQAFKKAEKAADWILGIQSKYEN